MNLTIKEKVAKSNNLTISEALLLLFLDNKGEYKKSVDSLVEKGFLTFASVGDKFPGPYLSRKAKETINTVIIDSTDNKSSEEELDNLAKELKKIFPKGKKPGSNMYWSGGVLTIKRRLRLFFKKYGEYPAEDIIKASKNYVNGFNGNYKTMRTLKYFIFKEDVNAAGEVESLSDLIDYMSNLGTDEELEQRADWTSELS